MTIRVLVADDHRLMREGLALVLGKFPDILVVGEAVDGREALAAVEHLRPDVLLLDVFMPHLDGIEVARRVRVAYPEMRVVILTMDSDSDDLRQLLAAGVAGVVMKDARSTEVARAIRGAVCGEYVYDPVVGSLAVQTEPSPATTQVAATFDLTLREQQILGRLTLGESNKEIAHALALSEKTIRNHLSHLFAKLAVADRTQAVILAFRHGLVATRGEQQE